MNSPRRHRGTEKQIVRPQRRRDAEKAKHLEIAEEAEGKSSRVEIHCPCIDGNLSPLPRSAQHVEQPAGENPMIAMMHHSVCSVSSGAEPDAGLDLGTLEQGFRLFSLCLCVSVVIPGVFKW